MIYLLSDRVKDFPFALPAGAQLLNAKDYIAGRCQFPEKHPLLYNLCRSYAYQSLGYYVSLLAEARGHRVLPGVSTCQDFNMQAFVRRLTEDSQSLISKSLASLQSDEFYLSVYFGKNMAKRHEPLAAHLFSLFPAPLMRVHFLKQRNASHEQEWHLHEVRPLPASDIPSDYHAFAKDALAALIQRRRPPRENNKSWRYDLAILCDSKEKHPPSNARALAKFARCAADRGLRVEFIGREDRSRLREFDALFIRETTRVNHHTYQFARRAKADNLVVIDDPDSILKCTNKVFLAELMARHKIQTPRTVIVHKSNKDAALEELGLPCVLKQPDSAFSQGVIKVSSEDEWQQRLDELLANSELVIAQEFLPSSFDWRIGVLDRKPLYACKYYMARAHWQIIHHTMRGVREGSSETLALAEVPPAVLAIALNAANAIGDGFYGVDLKEVDGQIYLIEVNDNPSIDAGVEDKVLKDALYFAVIDMFVARLEASRKRG